jgi:hypothetical protein
MVLRPSLRLALAWATLAPIVVACSGKHTRHPDSSEVLMTADGDEIAYQSTRCLYQQSTGADDTLSLQLQYLDTPNSVAFALYIDDPRPARPFRATPGEVGACTLEVAFDGTMYSTALRGTELALNLDALPAPATLTPGDTVRLRGTLKLDALSLPVSGDSAAAPLDLAAGSVPLDCEASYDESIVLD